MRIPTLPFPATLSPLKVVPALKVGLADLARARRTWRSVMPDQPAPDDDGRLEEVGAFGPNSGNLLMLRFVPPGWPAGAPLVVVLHGCTQTAAGYDKGTGWSTLAARHGFALLYPEQRRTNNAHLCFNWFEPGDTTRGHGEVASVRSMVAWASSDLRCDPVRVFVTGLSAGGAMTSALLATYPDVFTAGAIIAGLPHGAAHSTQEALGAMYHPSSRPAAERGAVVRGASPAPQRKPIVSIWHGAADTTVAPANAVEQVKQWCDVHGLDDRHGTTGTVDGATHTEWRDGGGTVRVESYSVPGLAHGTPIAPSQPGDRGVGTAMPHVLQAGIASTWHIARTWGLLT